MKSLFLRIFLLNWIIHVAVLAAMILVARQMGITPPSRPRDSASTAHPPWERDFVGLDSQETRDFAEEPILPPAGGLPSSHVGPPQLQPRNLKEFPGRRAFPMIGMVVGAGAVALVLATYVTRPVRRLRAATRRFAAGNLDARVGPSVTNRNDVIGDLGREFDLMAARIEALITAQRRLLQDVSHELRSPLARLNVALGIAYRKAGCGANSALARIEHESSQLNELIGQLLALNRLESNMGQIERREIDLLKLVQHVVADADFEAAERGCRVRLHPPEPCPLYGDGHLLHSAIENVVRNAIRHTTPGTDVELEVTQRVEEGIPYAIVSVRDHGPGVPDEHLMSIFKPFHRAEDARERDRGGAGLGLAITQRIANLHGGSVAARNAPDGGLVVEIALGALTRNDAALLT